MKKYFSFTPPVFPDAEETRLAALHYTFLPYWMMSIVFFSFLLVILLPANIERWIVLSTMVCIASSISLFLTKKGFVRLASIGFVLQLWLIVSLFVYTAGGMSAPSITCYLLVIFASVILQGKRAGLVTALFCIATEFGFAYLEQEHLLPVSVVLHTPYTRWVSQTTFIALFFALVYLAEREIINALSRERDAVTQRALAETALRKSEEKFAKSFMAAPAGIALSTLKTGKLIAINREYARVYGFEQGEILNQTSFELGIWFNPDDRERLMQLLAEKKVIRDIDLQMYNKKREVLTLRYSAEVITLDDEQYLLSAFIDVTERKHAEEALQKSEANYRALAHNTPDIITLFDRNLRYIYANAAVTTITGLKPEDFIGKTMEEVGLTGGPSAHRKKLIENVFATGLPQVTEFLSERQNIKRVFHWQAFPVTDAQRNIVSVFSVSRDITEHKKAEEAIKENAERYRDVVEGARDAIFSLSVHGTILSLNQAFETITGWPRDEWQGKSFSDLLHPDDVAKAANGFRMVVEGNPGPLNELRVRKKSGEYLIGEFISMPQIKNGKVISVLGIARDVTQRKQLEEQFRRTQRLEGLGKLASGIAHDLNNVLAPILLSVEVLRKRLKQPELDKMIATLGKSATRGTEIVKQILSFARGSEGKPALQQLRYVIKEMESIIKETFPKDIEVKTDIGKDIHLIMGDATQLHQILLNLSVNARDAMPNGGSITIAASNMTVSEMDTHIGIPAGEYVRLRVGDSGTGIPPEIQEKIFEPFFTTKETGKGTGLGLSTVFGIVNDHNGTIKLYSEPGRGTEFHIYFPAVLTSGTSAANEQQERQETLPQGNGELILIIDDEQSVLLIAKETLEAYGYRTLTASDGATAVEIFSSQPNGSVAIVVSDIDMPRMSGPETCRLIRRFDPNIKLIMTSGMLGNITSERLLGITVQGYITKPYTTKQLLETLYNALHG